MKALLDNDGMLALIAATLAVILHITIMIIIG
jgi:hypothetical protein